MYAGCSSSLFLVIEILAVDASIPSIWSAFSNPPVFDWELVVPLLNKNLPSLLIWSLSVPSVITLKCPLVPVSTTSADVLPSSILSNVGVPGVFVVQLKFPLPSVLRTSSGSPSSTGNVSV